MVPICIHLWWYLNSWQTMTSNKGKSHMYKQSLTRQRVLGPVAINKRWVEAKESEFWLLISQSLSIDLFCHFQSNLSNHGTSQYEKAINHCESVVYGKIRGWFPTITEHNTRYKISIYWQPGNWTYENLSTCKWSDRFTLHIKIIQDWRGLVDN